VWCWRLLCGLGEGEGGVAILASHVVHGEGARPPRSRDDAVARARAAQFRSTEPLVEHRACSRVRAERLGECASERERVGATA
jgi:hypothetical protein